MQVDGTALVTGASRGIGRALTLELAARGFDVVATMRRPADGEDLPKQARALPGRVSIARLDVTDPETIEIPDDLSLLVNNAGVEGPYLPVETASLSVWREIFETNLFGLIEMTRRALPVLRKRGGGVICNVTSCSILVPMPLFAAYRASKAAVSALGESLRSEVGAFGIRVVEIQPGAIATDMLAGSNRMPEAAASQGYAELAQRVFEARSGVGDAVTSPEDAARAIADAILDDRAPLRNPCDPMGEGLLSAWRASDDETMMSGMLSLFGASPS